MTLLVQDLSFVVSSLFSLIIMLYNMSLFVPRRKNTLNAEKKHENTAENSTRRKHSFISTTKENCIQRFLKFLCHTREYIPKFKKNTPTRLCHQKYLSKVKKITKERTKAHGMWVVYQTHRTLANSIRN